MYVHRAYFALHRIFVVATFDVFTVQRGNVGDDNVVVVVVINRSHLQWSHLNISRFFFIFIECKNQMDAATAHTHEMFAQFNLY